MSYCVETAQQDVLNCLTALSREPGNEDLKMFLAESRKFLAEIEENDDAE